MTRYLGELEQLVLLAVLQLEDEAYGVTIRRLLVERTPRELSLATVYTTLERLETKGFVRARLGESTPERGGRRKKYFRVTAPGERALREAIGAVRALARGLGRGLVP